MKKLLAGVTALVTVGATGCFGVGTASADDTPHQRAAECPAAPGDQTAYALGGAHVLGIPYDEYIKRTGAEWFPGQKRQIVDYPAGQVQGHVLERLFPGIGRTRRVDHVPGPGPRRPQHRRVGRRRRATTSTRRSADGRPGTAIGLSEGAFVLDAVQATAGE